MPATSTSALTLAAGGDRLFGRFTLRGVTGGMPGGVTLALARDDGAELELVVAPRGYPQALVRTRHGDVYYRRFTGLTEAEVADCARAFAELLDEGALPIVRFFPHLAVDPKPDADFASQRRELARLMAPEPLLLTGGAAAEPAAIDRLLPVLRQDLFFDAPGLADFLAPELAVDGAPVAGHVLRAIYLPAVGRKQQSELTAYVLEFEARPGGDGAEYLGPLESNGLVRIELRAGGARDAFGSSGDLHLRVLGFEGKAEALPPTLASLASWLLALLHLKGAPMLKLRLPRSTDELRALSVPKGRDRDREEAPREPAHDDGRPPALNLAIDTECGQRCTFCSVKSYVRPTDEGEAGLASARFDLRAARERGVDEVRLNGIDPLTFSRVLEVVDEVRALGFRKLSVYSPCRRFADDAFRRDFLARAPDEVEVSVPLYGVTAAAHDAVVGTPGAFTEVIRAIEALQKELKAPSKLRLSTVVVKQNLHELADVIDFARARDLPMDGHLSYPMRQTLRDPYAESAVPEREVVEALVGQLASRPKQDRGFAFQTLGGIVLHPCLLFAAEKRHRLPVFAARERHEHPLLHGTQYRSSAFVHGADEDDSHDGAFAVATTPCPHVSRCALAPACAGEQYAVYREKFGLQEFRPVSVDELYSATPLSPFERSPG